MPVPTLISELSQTPASNSPVGTVDVPSSIDDYQRTHAAFIATLRDGKGFTSSSALASGATTDIGAQNALFVDISGTTTITSLGANYNGPRFLRFAGALTLTHNATTLVLPGGANITTAAGDTMLVIPKTTAAVVDGWAVIAYQRNSGVLVAASELQAQTFTAFTTAGTSTAYTLMASPAITSLNANQRFRVKFNAANTTTTPTLSINGLAATALKIYDTAGVKQNPAVGALALNMLTDVEYDGTDMVVLDPLVPAASSTVPGVVELATTAEALTGTDTASAVTPAGLATSRRIAQVVNTTTGAVNTTLTSESIPQDDTVPQITEGKELMTRAITPVSASSDLEVDVVFHGTVAAVAGLTVALFRDSAANAIAAMTTTVRTSGDMQTISFKTFVSAASMAASTFRVRAGASSASVLTFNGTASSRYMGGVMSSSITIKEYLP